jgi:hypothetical protein
MLNSLSSAAHFPILPVASLFLMISFRGSFIAEAASAWVLEEGISSKVEVSSPEVGANVGDLFSNAMNQEQGNTMLKVNILRPSKHYFY